MAIRFRSAKPAQLWELRKSVEAQIADLVRYRDKIDRRIQYLDNKAWLAATGQELSAALDAAHTQREGE